MAQRIDDGCGTPANASLKAVHQRLVQIFAPVVFFDPQERFFPVDLPTTIQHSSLWLVEPDATPQRSRQVKGTGQIDLAHDLPTATGSHYTTVAGTGTFQKTLEGQPPFTMPTPLLDQVLAKYTSGDIPAVLTMYATVCSAADLPGAFQVRNCEKVDPAVRHAMAEGVVVNYFMYFPARVSPEFRSEGDWSGISLLLLESPTQLAQLNDPQELSRYLPVVASYYRKTIDGAPPSPAFVATPSGIRRWQAVRRVREPAIGMDTHPVVHVSLGRHNCYFEPVTTPISLSPPWGGFGADRIETGGYAAGPANTTLIGGGVEDIPWWGYALFPPLAPMVACATGCEYPVQFDGSGLPLGYEEGDDQATDGGYAGVPGGNGGRYPTLPAGQVQPPARQVGLRLQYVDLDDAATAALWGYGGAWGGASLNTATTLAKPEEPSKWGYYLGARRPALAAWCTWNLFLDATFGCAGVPALTRSP